MTTKEIYLERIDRAKNMARYYRLSVVPTLFGDYAIVREWGRIGRGGQAREEGTGDLAEAMTIMDRYCSVKVRRGYAKIANEIAEDDGCYPAGRSCLR